MEQMAPIFIFPLHRKPALIVKRLAFGYTEAE